MSERTSVPDIPPDAGKRPAFARPIDRAAGDTIGTGDGYSGQEYDAPGQEAWRAEQRRHRVPASGEVEGSGAGAGGGNPGEDYDSDSMAGSGYPRTGAAGEDEILKDGRSQQRRFQRGSRSI